MRHRARVAIATGAVMAGLIATFAVFAPTAYAATITQTAPTTGRPHPVFRFVERPAQRDGEMSALVTFAQLTGGPQLLVSASGLVTTNGTLPVGMYTTTGTTSDTAANTGVFTFTLTVSAGTIAQSPPTTGTVPASTSASFSAQLNTTGGIGSVHFAQTTGSQLNVSGSGLVTTTGARRGGTTPPAGILMMLR